MNIIIGGTLYSSRYEYDLLQAFSLLHALYDPMALTVSQLDEALRRLQIDPVLLYSDLSVGYETPSITALVQALALPPFPSSSATPGGYWEQRLIEMAKLDGKPQEEIGRIDADLTNASASMSLAIGHFVGKEEIARIIVEMNESVRPDSSTMRMDVMQQAVDASKLLMQLPNPSNPNSASSVMLSGLDDEGNAASETINIEANNGPVYSTKRYRMLNNPTTGVTTRKERIPYYAKNKNRYWKKR